MADAKISALTGATTPLGGTEVVPVVQSSSTKKVSIADLTAGRAVTGLSFATTNVTVGASAVTAGTDISYSVNSGATQTVSAAYTTGSSRPALRMYSVGANHDMILQFTDLCRFYNAAGDTKVAVDHLNSKITSDYNLAFANGQGIDFSATTQPAAGMTSELLSDYEEGTWTPAITSASGVVTLVDPSACTYTKVGRLVYIFARVGITTDALVGTSNLTITGLPFTVYQVSLGNFAYTNFSSADYGVGGAQGLVYVDGTSLSHVARTINISSRSSTFYWMYAAVYSV